MKNTISYDETRRQFMRAEDPIDIDTAISLLDSDTVKWEIGASLMANKTKDAKAQARLQEAHDETHEALKNQLADTLQAEIAELNKQLVIKDELIAELREDATDESPKRYVVAMRIRLKRDPRPVKTQDFCVRRDNYQSALEEYTLASKREDLVNVSLCLELKSTELVR